MLMMLLLMMMMMMLLMMMMMMMMMTPQLDLMTYLEEVLLRPLGMWPPDEDGKQQQPYAGIQLTNVGESGYEVVLARSFSLFPPPWEKNCLVTQCPPNPIPPYVSRLTRFPPGDDFSLCRHPVRSSRRVRVGTRVKSCRSWLSCHVMPIFVLLRPYIVPPTLLPYPTPLPLTPSLPLITTDPPRSRP
jgi:hypothetical protein